MGRLHTRYAPVRRSPSNPYCYFITLPLDLHVLSLPLAFILSQDQTLHCKKFNVLLESWLFQFFLKGNWQINTTLFSQYRKPVNQRTIFLNFRAPIFRSGKWCKGKAKKLNHQIFGELFSNFFSRTSAATSSKRCFPDCGCKDTAYFLFSKLFNHFFAKKIKISKSRTIFTTIYRYRYREFGGEEKGI